MDIPEMLTLEFIIQIGSDWCIGIGQGVKPGHDICGKGLEHACRQYTTFDTRVLLVTYPRLGRMELDTPYPHCRLFPQFTFEGIFKCLAGLNKPGQRRVKLGRPPLLSDKGNQCLYTPEP